MNFVIGLGNPGETYALSRHNAGFMAVDEMWEQWKVDSQLPAFLLENKWPAEVSRAKTLLLAKPHTFMNNSGQAARALLQFYDKASLARVSQGLTNLWVCHDDLDLQLGQVKIQFGTGPKVHNGLSSLYQHLGTQQFWHVRLGIDARQGDRSLPGSAYVLQSFTKTERAELATAIAKASAQVAKQMFDQPK